jgi:hypothetical protein
MSTLAATNLKHASSASNNIVLDSSGNVGIGISTNESGFKLHVVGNAFVQNTSGQTTGKVVVDSADNRLVLGSYFEAGVGQYSFISSTDNAETGNIPLLFRTGTTERLRIDSSGNVGIGTSSPLSATNYKFVTVQGGSSGGGYSLYNSSGAEAGRFQADINQVALYNWTASLPTTFYSNSTERMRIDSSGNLLVGTATQSNSALLTIASPASGISLSAIGRIYSLGTYNNTTASAANLVVALDGHFFRSTSSRKYKRDIQDATFGLSDVLALRPVTYKGNAEADGDTVFGGLIAEEVHTAGLTQFVQYAADGTPDALSYGNMVALCVKAIQELKADNDAMKERIATLEAK